MKQENNQLPAEVWLDYVEGEVDKTLKQDLELVLQHRPEYRKTVKELTELKKNIKDPVQDLPADEKFKKLKTNIMQAIEKVEPDKKISPWHRHNKVMTYTTMAVAAVVTGGLMTQSLVKGNKKSTTQYSIEDQLVAQNVVDVHALNDLSEEVLIEAASEVLSELPESVAKSEMEKLK